VLEASPAFLSILKDLIRSIELDGISCNLRFGLDDPALTAVLSGYLWSVASASGLLHADVLLEPCFDGERLEGSLMARLRARMLWIVVAAFRGLCEKQTRRLMAKVVRGR
jgi:hypothetical protein